VSHLEFNIAEASRPFRELKKKKKEDVQKTRQKQVQVYVSAARTNWFTPFLWQHILWAGNHCKPQMRPSEIVKILKLKFPLLFGALTTQVLGRWIDRKASPPQWSDKVLKLAEAGNRPQSHCKRAGILVRIKQYILYPLINVEIVRTHTPM
jgi:hypothetical protein